MTPGVSAGRGAEAGTDEAAPGTVRVLVVEDEFLVAAAISDDLLASGHVVIGPFGTLAQARAAADREAFDLALLDVNLRGESSLPLADELAARGKPFLLLTGYAAAHLPERFRSAPRLTKPYDPSALMREIHRLAAQ